MPRKRPQVLGADLKSSESRRRAACPSMRPAQAPGQASMSPPAAVTTTRRNGSCRIVLSQGSGRSAECGKPLRLPQWHI